MDAGDYIMIVQTLVVFLTGVVLVWYTCETRALRKTSQRQALGLERAHKIAAKSALLASYMQYLSIIEARNNILFSAGRSASHDTSEIRKKIDAIEAELELLIGTNDA